MEPIRLNQGLQDSRICRIVVETVNKSAVSKSRESEFPPTEELNASEGWIHKIVQPVNYCRVRINFCDVFYNLCELVLTGRSQADSHFFSGLYFI